MLQETQVELNTKYAKPWQPVCKDVVLRLILPGIKYNRYVGVSINLLYSRGLIYSSVLSMVQG